MSASPESGLLPAAPIRRCRGERGTYMAYVTHVTINPMQWQGKRNVTMNGTKRMEDEGGMRKGSIRCMYTAAGIENFFHTRTRSGAVLFVIVIHAPGASWWPAIGNHAMEIRA
eukprot:2363579-Pyramimonas_sp.AAC.1